jgi:transcriptional regulator with XRE-family HTH domain
MSLAAYAEPVTAFGDQLRAWRLRSGISQENLGKRLGHKRPSTVQSWERGRRPPKPVHIAALADALGLSVEERRLAMDLLAGLPTEQDAQARAAAQPAAPPMVDPLEQGLADIARQWRGSRDDLEAFVNSLRKAIGLPALALRRGRRPA